MITLNALSTYDLFKSHFSFDIIEESYTVDNTYVVMYNLALIVKHLYFFLLTIQCVYGYEGSQSLFELGID
jgi:hypothetical protein